MIRKVLLITAISIAILVSGCLTLTVDSKVNSDGDVVKYTMVIDTTSTIYNLINSQVDDEGMNLRQSVVSQGGTYDEEWDGDDVKITIQGIEPENVYTEREGDFLIYRDLDSRYSDIEGDMRAVKVHYYLEMPGEIVESNADFVEGNKAEWHMVDFSSNKSIYAKSEVPAVSGFGLVAGLFSLLIVGRLLKR